MPLSRPAERVSRCRSSRSARLAPRESPRDLRDEWPPPRSLCRAPRSECRATHKYRTAPHSPRRSTPYVPRLGELGVPIDAQATPIAPVGPRCATQVAPRAPLGAPTAPNRRSFERSRHTGCNSRRAHRVARCDSSTARHVDGPRSWHRSPRSRSRLPRSTPRSHRSPRRRSRSEAPSWKTSLLAPRSTLRASRSPFGRPRSSPSPPRRPLPGPA